ncbi:MAG: hypothetical protein ACYDEX_18735 [Mobilitalea sp.]
MKKKKITGQQIKFIINMVSIAIFAISYLYIYTDYVEKTEATYTNIDLVKKTIESNKKKISEEGTIIKDTDLVDTEIETIIDRFPVDVSKVDGYMFIEQMEKTLKISFASTNVTSGTPFYETILPIRNEDGTEVDQGAVSAAADSTSAEVDTTAATETSGSTATDVPTESLDNIDEEIAGDSTNSSTNTTNTGTNDALKLQTMTGLQSTISMNFLTTYSGFKELVKYINNYPEKTVIDSISISSDALTGNLTGSMVLKRFALTGTGKVYEAPIIDDINIGTDNIFGTDTEVIEEETLPETQTDIVTEQ